MFYLSEKYLFQPDNGKNLPIICYKNCLFGKKINYIKMCTNIINNILKLSIVLFNFIK